MPSIRSRLVAAFAAFRQPALVAQLFEPDDFEDYENRRVRYSLLWAFFENNAYDKVHTWASSYLKAHGLYRYTRGIYNPSYRLGTFWQQHLWGGKLDPDAGDGLAVHSALPIVTENEQLRPMLGQLWQESNWQLNKDLLTLWGAVLGDVVLQVVDDTARGRVRIQPMSPYGFEELDLDEMGNVRGYVYREMKEHPEKEDATAEYKEECERDGDLVVYRTYLDDSPYAWPGQDDDEEGEYDEWEVPYSFVPMVAVQHNDVGLDWGWSELHPGRTKVHEADDIASKLSDQVRKAVDPKWLFTGVSPPDGNNGTVRSEDGETYSKSADATHHPQPGREEMGALYGPVGSTANALVYPLDMASSYQHLGRLLAELERDYPELQMDIWTASGDASGRALRVARQRVEKKVRQRRVNYDDALVRVQQMALSIAGWRGYEGYRGVSLDTYWQGGLDFEIGDRPVFAEDPLDDATYKTAFWTAAKAAVAAGCPLPFYLEHEAGWDEDKLGLFEEAMEAQAMQGMGAIPWLLEAGPGDEEGESPIPEMQLETAGQEE